MGVKKTLNCASPTSMDCCSKVSQSLAENPKELQMFSLGIFFSWLVRVLRSQFLYYESVIFEFPLQKKTSYFDEGDHIAGRFCLPNNFLVWHHAASLECKTQKLHVGTSRHHISWYCWWPISCEPVEVGSFSHRGLYVRGGCLGHQQYHHDIFLIHVRKLLSKNHMVNQNRLKVGAWQIQPPKLPARILFEKILLDLIRPWKFTWNLKVTQLKRKNHLPYLHCWVPFDHHLSPIPPSLHVPCSLPTCS